MRNEILAKRLWSIFSAFGVEHVFGLPGTQNLFLYEALRASPLIPVTALSETSAMFMAQGYFRSSGRMAGVCTIGGPGFSLAFNGLAEASADSAALALVVSTSGFETFRPKLQQLPLESLSQGIARHFISIDNASDFDSRICQALQHAVIAEPGPVVIAIHNTLSQTRAPLGELAFSRHAPSDEASISRAVARLVEAKRPLFFLGQGAAGASDALRALCERLNILAITTCSGRGVLPDSSSHLVRCDFSLGVSDYIKHLCSTADLIIALGTKLSFNGTGGYELPLASEKLIHVDQANVFSQTYLASLNVLSTVENFVNHLHDPALSEPKTWELADIARYQQSAESSLSAAVIGEFNLSSPLSCSLSQFFRLFSEHASSDSIYTLDAGIHQECARRGLQISQPRSLLAPTDFQSMGFGVPAAIGAALANPQHPVFAITGDGALHMTGSELLTARKLGQNLGCIVCVDGYYGLIRQQQIEAFGQPFETTLPSFSLREYAAAYDLPFFRAETEQDVSEFIATPGVRVLEVPLSTTIHNRLQHASKKLREVSATRLPKPLVNFLKRFRSGTKRPGL